MSATSKAVRLEPPTAFSVKRVAAALDVSAGFVRLEIARGNLRARRAGGRLLILREDIENWLRRSPEPRDYRATRCRAEKAESEVKRA